MKPFSPLFIGEYSATRLQQQAIKVVTNFQSPLHRGILCNDVSRSGRGSVCSLSVPSSSGNTLQLPCWLPIPKPSAAFSPLFIGEYSATSAPRLP